MAACFECTPQAIKVARVTASMVLLGPPVYMS